MVLGLLRHIYRYYVPENFPSGPPPVPPKDVQHHPSATASGQPPTSLIPVYADNDHSAVLYFIQRPPVLPAPSAGNHDQGGTKVALASQDPQLALVPALASSLAPLLTPTPQVLPQTALTKMIPVAPILPQPSHAPVNAQTSMPMHQTVTGTSSVTHATSTGVTHPTWSSWPDGDFVQTFTEEEFKATEGLKVHWSTRSHGRGGNRCAEDPLDGLRVVRECNGIIVCSNYPVGCSRIVRPHATGRSRQRQLEKLCQICQSPLLHLSCPVSSTIYYYSGGVHYQNGGHHNHPRIPHVLHALASERKRFKDLVVNNPKAKPNELVAGLATAYGTGPPAEAISNVYANKDRVGRESREIKRGATAGTETQKYHQAFAAFAASHPGFVHQTIHGFPTVISFQTPFMLGLAVKDEEIIDEPLNGILSDTTHSFFAGLAAYLMTSSSFDSIIQRWVPVLWSYLDGLTTEHFHYHFLALFKAIAAEVERRGLELKPSHFLLMLDFSLAERNGARSAYIAFWKERGDTRSEEDLQSEAENLMKGCREHYFASVTRVSRLGAVIPADKRIAFKTRAMDLASLPTPKEFLEELVDLKAQFPLAKPWFDWWSKEDNARLLFISMRDMDVQLWESMPSTNNAQEALHWSFYSTYGHDHDFFGGAGKLYSIALAFERQHFNEKLGKPTTYGQMSEKKKKRMNRSTRTKPHLPPRDPRDRTITSPSKKRYKNDGRPKDTTSALLQEAAKIASPVISPTTSQNNAPQTQHQISAIHPNQGYIWEENSCWIDSFLELTFRAIFPHFKDFEAAFKDSTPRILPLFTALKDRYYATESGSLSPAMLTEQKIVLRRHLLDSNCLKTPSMNSFENVFAWLSSLFETRDHDITSFSAQSYFEELVLNIGQCEGDEGVDHLYLLKSPRRRLLRAVTDDGLFQMHKGKIQSWFLSLFMESYSESTCWRNGSNKPESIPDCPGHCVQSDSFVVSLPVLMVIEAKLEIEVEQGSWHFPNVLVPPGGTPENGQVYELVGAVFASQNHFVCRYASPDFHSVFHYDGQRNNGVAEKVKGGYKKLLTGSITCPDGFDLWAVMYRLKGGVDAQAAFCAARWKALEEETGIRIRSRSLSPDLHPLSSIPSVSYSKPGFRSLSSKEQPWFPVFTKSIRQRIEYQVIGNDSVHDCDSGPESEMIDGFHSEQESGTESHPLEVQHDPTPSCQNSLKETKAEPTVHTTSGILKCRCGDCGDASSVDVQHWDGNIIQCTQCKRWSHIACQRECRASSLGKKTSFQCDECSNYDSQLVSARPFRQSVRQRRLALAKPTTKLSLRLRPGLGVLAKWGTFWYPARLIYKADDGWIVDWWNRNHYDGPGPQQARTVVEETDIVDSLWGDRDHRRGIRLGLWERAVDAVQTVDLLVVIDIKAFPYSPEVDNALHPHSQVLKDLLHNPGKDPIGTYVPARLYLQATSTGRIPDWSTYLPYVHGLTLTQLGEVMNWMDRHLFKTEHQPEDWVHRLPFAHALTLLLAAQSYEIGPPPKWYANPTFPKEKMGFSAPDDPYLVLCAWEALTSKDPLHTTLPCDIGWETLHSLEKLLFDCTVHAGLAGYYQWGLDAGDHQNAWYPYAGYEPIDPGDVAEFPEEWLQQGADFISIRLPTPQPTIPAPPRPKPRPRRNIAAGETVGVPVKPVILSPQDMAIDVLTDVKKIVRFTS